MSVKKNLEKILLERNLKKKDVAEGIGLSRQAFSNFLFRDKFPQSALIELSKFLNISIDYLLTGENYMAEEPRAKYNVGQTKDFSDDEIQKHDRFVEVPVIQEVGAGEFSLSCQEIIDYVYILKSYVQGWSEECLFGVRVNGDSMRPRLERGDTVITSTEARFDTRTGFDNGKIVILSNGDGGCCKKGFTEPKEKRIRLHSTNPNYKDKYLSYKEIEAEELNIFKAIAFLGKL